MSSIESQQVRLKLTEIPYVLSELRKKRRLVRDEKTGAEIFNIQFDSRTFSFQKGKVITVGGNVAEALNRDAWVIVGDALVGEITPVLEVIESFEVGSGELLNVSKTICPICHEDQITVKQLVKHISTHENDEDAPEPEDEDERETVAPVHPSARSRRAAASTSSTSSTSTQMTSQVSDDGDTK